MYIIMWLTVEFLYIEILLDIYIIVGIFKCYI